jgi:hypothetical protein
VTLVPARPPRESENDLRARLTALEAELAHRAAELGREQTELASFRIRYRREVGHLHEQLDDLERAIAELELGEISRRLEDAGRDPAGPGAEARGDAGPQLTSDAVRRLFREVAKTIHPDLARDDHTRDRRHRLMAEANRAYALGDEERLRRILEAWENSPEAVPESDPDAARLRLVRRIAQLEDELAEYANELAALRSSPLGKLKAMVDESAARGKDLVGDMVRRLKRDILVAQNRLDAMLPRA